MHRMRSPLTTVGLTFILASIVGAPSFADLIKAPDPANPDIVGIPGGTQSYVYDPTTRTGTFHVSATPYLLLTGTEPADEAEIKPNADGIRSQVLNLKLDRNGHLVSSVDNSYTVYGTVVLGGQTYNGLLLRGTPTAFASQGGTASIYNLDLKITGGALALKFGTDAFMQIVTGHTEGNFTKSFHTTIASTTTRAHQPFRGVSSSVYTPEPTTLVVLLAGGAGLVARKRCRITCADLDG